MTVPFCAQCTILRDKLASSNKRPTRDLIRKVIVYPDSLELVIDVTSLASLSQTHLKEGAPTTFVHTAQIRLKRSGRSLKLVHDNGVSASRTPDQALANLLARSRQWWDELSQGKTDIASLSRREQVTASYVTRVVRLAFLAPSVIEAILSGKANSDVDGKVLLLSHAITPSWSEQEARLLPKV